MYKSYNVHHAQCARALGLVKLTTTPAFLFKKSVVCYVTLACMHGAAQRFQMAKNPPKISSPKVISRVFPYNFQHILIASVSGHSLRFTFKVCQIVAGISTISQFHEFLDLVFGGFLQYDPTVWRSTADSLLSST